MAEKICRPWAFFLFAPTLSPIFESCHFSMFLSYHHVIKKTAVSSQTHSLDCVLTKSFSQNVNQNVCETAVQVLYPFFWREIFMSGYLIFKTWRTFCVTKRTGLVESFGMFMFTTIFQTQSYIFSFFVSIPFWTYFVLTLSTEQSPSVLWPFSFRIKIDLRCLGGRCGGRTQNSNCRQCHQQCLRKGFCFTIYIVWHNVHYNYNCNG